MRFFQPGERVILNGHWEFEDGIVGTVVMPDDAAIELSEPGEWQGCRRIHPGRRGPITSYLVKFDEPQDDGSGDGPYWAAEIDAEGLTSLVEPPGRNE
jgi:hypothetical protein